MPNNVTTLIFSCNDISVLLALVTATGRSFRYAKVHAEDQMPHEDPVAAWSTATESLIAWELTSNTSPLEPGDHHGSTAYFLASRNSNASRSRTRRTFDLQVVRLASPSLRAIQLTMYDSRLQEPLTQWSMERRSWPQALNLVVNIVGAERKNLDMVESSYEVLDELEASGLRVETHRFEWGPDELSFGWGGEVSSNGARRAELATAEPPLRLTSSLSRELSRKTADRRSVRLHQM